MYFLRRLLFLIPLLLLISFLAFILVRVAPGGPFDKERKPASPEIERHLRAKYHLDEPLLKQYARYLEGVVRGDFGPSLKYRSYTVTEIIKQGLPVSLMIGGLAFLLALGLGLPLGIWTALKRGQWQDHFGNFLALLAVCTPAFVIGPMLIILFAIHWQWFPVALWESPLHALLPTVTLSLFFAGKIARIMREGMLVTLQSGFITTARAKGMSEMAVVLKHALPLALLPVLSYSGPLLADLLTGSFVVENLFQIPGIGVFMVNSSLNRDYPMVVGLVLLYSVLLLILNLVVDWLYSVLDPRVKLG
jgi:oligopeptide transport system permease protein